MRIHQIRAFRDWIAERIGDPFATVERFLPRLPSSDAMKMIKEAEVVRDDLQSFGLGTALFQRFIKTEEGASFLIKQMLEKHHGGATIDDALAIAMALGEQKMSEVLVKAAGSVPNAEGAAAVSQSPEVKPADGAKGWEAAARRQAMGQAWINVAPPQPPPPLDANGSTGTRSTEDAGTVPPAAGPPK